MTLYTSDDPAQLSDGHHTMQDLYDHRRALTAALAAVASPHSAYRTRRHNPADPEPMFPGHFLVAIHLVGQGEIRYHYRLRHWDEFAAVTELPWATLWDGAGPADTVTRLLTWADPRTHGRAPATPGELRRLPGAWTQTKEPQ